MPSSFTEIIEEEGGATVEDFLLRCARSRAWCNHQHDRDDLAVPPTKAKPSAALKENLEKARERLDALLAMTGEEIREAAEAAHRDALQSVQDSRVHVEALRQKYLDMKAQVEAWTPPTPGHQDVKDFALEQIDQSCPRPWDWDPPPRRAAAAWHLDQMAAAREEIRRLEVSQAEWDRYIPAQHAWVDALMASVADLKAKNAEAEACGGCPSCSPTGVTVERPDTSSKED